jgi:hypothetical protein
MKLKYTICYIITIITITLIALCFIYFISMTYLLTEINFTLTNIINI